MGSDRIPCFVEGCRRTAPASKYPPGTSIICQTHWKMVPKRFKDRYKSLKSKERKLLRAYRKRGIENPSLRFLHKQMDDNWQDIRNSFSNDQPEGLEAFLSMVGVGHQQEGRNID